MTMRDGDSTNEGSSRVGRNRIAWHRRRPPNASRANGDMMVSTERPRSRIRRRPHTHVDTSCRRVNSIRCGQGSSSSSCCTTARPRPRPLPRPHFLALLVLLLQRGANEISPPPFFAGAISIAVPAHADDPADHDHHDDHDDHNKHQHVPFTTYVGEHDHHRHHHHHHHHQHGFTPTDAHVSTLHRAHEHGVVEQFLYAVHEFPDFNRFQEQVEEKLMHEYGGEDEEEEAAVGRMRMGAKTKTEMRRTKRGRDDGEEEKGRQERPRGADGDGGGGRVTEAAAAQEDLSSVLAALREQRREEQDARAAADASATAATAARSIQTQTQTTQTQTKISQVIRQLLTDAALASLSSNVIALQGSCADGSGDDDGGKEGKERGKRARYAREDQEGAGSLPGEGEGEGGSGTDSGNEEEDATTMGSKGGFRLSMRELASAVRSSTAVAGMASDATVAAAAMAAASMEMKEASKDGDNKGVLLVDDGSGLKRKGGGDKWRKVDDKTIIIKKRETKDKSRPPRGSSEGGTTNFIDDTDFPELDPFAVEGARLLSASFALVSNSFGLLADTVRILGDTAAGATGSSVKLVGTAVKTVSGGLDGAGKLIEGKATKTQGEKDGEEVPPKKRKPLTSEKLLVGQKGGVKGLLHREYDEEGQNVLRSTRRVAGKSVRLLGSVVRGVGDSLLLAGSATESLASSTANVAEEAVRLVEDFAGSLSTTFRVEKESHMGRAESPIGTRPSDSSETLPHEHKWYAPVESEGQSFVSFGRHPDGTESESIPRDPDAGVSAENEDNVIIALLSILSSRSLAFIDFAMADTEGVPSFVPELLSVMIFCYVASILLLSRREPSSPDKSKVGQVSPKYRESLVNMEVSVPVSVEHRRVNVQPTSLGVDGLDVADTEDSHSLTTEEVEPIHREGRIDRGIRDEPNNRLGRIDSGIRHEPNGTSCRSFSKVSRIIRLLVIEPWRVTFKVIRFWFRVFFDRRMMLLGIYGVAWLYLCRASQMRSASIGRNAEVAGFRSAMSSAGNSSPSLVESAVWLNALLDEVWRVHYDVPSFKSHFTEYPKFITRAMKQPYGGLEPYLSSIFGAAIIDVLKTSSESRPSDIAYLSLHSFQLGSVPPIVRGVKLVGINEDEKTVNLDIDLDVLLGDSSLVLDIKLSNLDYALLPSTQVSIHSFDVRLPLDVSVETMENFPFLRSVKVSLSALPRCRVRVTPLSENSGLRGVDLGSLPVLNDWIQETLMSALAEYVSPSYIAFDLESLWYPPKVPSEIGVGSSTRAPADANLGSTRSQSGLPRATSVAGEKATAALNDPFSAQIRSSTRAINSFERRTASRRDKSKDTTPVTKKGRKRFASSLNAITNQLIEEADWAPKSSGFEAIINDEQQCSAH